MYTYLWSDDALSPWFIFEKCLNGLCSYFECREGTWVFIFEWIIPSTSKDSDGVVIASIIKSCLGLSNQPNPDILLTGKTNQPHRDTRFLLCPFLGLGVRGKGYDHKLMSTDGALVQRRPWRELKCHANASHEPKHKSPALPTGHRWVKQCLFQTWINFNIQYRGSFKDKSCKIYSHWDKMHHSWSKRVDRWDT